MNTLRLLPYSNYLETSRRLFPLWNFILRVLWLLWLLNSYQINPDIKLSNILYILTTPILRPILYLPPYIADGHTDYSHSKTNPVLYLPPNDKDGDSHTD